MKPLVIYFEGVDKSGKTALMKRFNFITKYKYLCIDRGPVSYYMYSQIYKRERHLQYSEIYALLARSIIVHVKCDAYTIESRARRSGHAYFDFNKHIKAFDDTIHSFKKHGVRVIEINTSVGHSIEGNTRELINKIELEISI